MCFVDTMEIKIIASDSMGVRSMATFVKTKKLNIFIDPSAALGPSRYGLPPHQLEIEELNKRWRFIEKYAKKSDIIIISHYHYDHYNPDEMGMFRDKIVIVKHPKQNINKSQTKRAAEFIPKLKEYAKQVNYADGSSLSFGKTEDSKGVEIKFSKAVPHGPSNRLGYVVETCISEGKQKFIHTSDVEGPALDEQVNFVLENRPDIVFLDGPLSYIIYRYGNANIKKSLENMKKILDISNLTTLIYDHHFLRDAKFKQIIKPVIDYGKQKGKRVLTAAEFMGEELRSLELMRKDLYKGITKIF